jgi:Bifunctional DNA primase/polymerase, N-terminal
MSVTQTIEKVGRYASIALPMARKGVLMTPVRPNSKAAFLPDFPTTATTNEKEILELDARYPDHNGACVARAEIGNCWFFEMDSADVRQRIKNDTGYDVMELNTFKVRSRAGRGHLYFKHNAASLTLGNISQTYVKCQDWSARTDREYVVAAGSTLPDRENPYTAMNDAEIIEAPQWLIDWLVSQKTSGKTEKKEAPRNERGLVPHGAIHGFLLTNAGRLRAMGLDEEPIRVALRDLVEKNCQPPIDWSKVDAMAKSICIYPEGEDKSLAMTQKGAVTLVGGTVAEVEADETDEEIAPAPTSLLLPDRVLSSTVLGDLYGEVFQPNGWTMELALPALATAGSVLVPCKEGGIELNNSMVSLYTALIAPAGGGKSQVTEWASKALGIYHEKQAEHYTQVRFGSAEQMWKYLHKHSAGVSQTPRAFRDSVLINSDEWSHVMSKAGIPDASLPSTLTSAFYRRKHTVTLGGQGGGKDLHIPFAFSMIGGIVEDEFESVFNAASVGGLYDRFLFGLPPKDFKWNYREFPSRLPTQVKAVPVKIDGSVYEVLDVWNIKYPTMGRVVEVCLRVATIFASLDGRGVVL